LLKQLQTPHIESAGEGEDVEKQILSIAKEMETLNFIARTLMKIAHF
jgi:hypothetical protein